MMKKKISIITFVLIAFVFSGCSGERRRVSRETNALTRAYEIKMDKGETTSEQDKRFIRAMSKVALELDRNIRGTKKANETRKEAEALATGAESFNNSMNLD